MSKHILFNEANVLAARFDSLINTSIPVAAIEVNDELFFKTINEQDGVWVHENGEVLKKPFPAPTLSELKLAKKAEITQQFNLTMSQIVGDTPAHEISSWGKQEMEARAYVNPATSTNPTPLIDNLATSRGMPKVLLASKIVAKADLFASYSGNLIGKRQGLEDSIDAATSKTALAAIVW